MVKLIFKNTTLLNLMKNSVKDLVSNFDDIEVLQNIAENFASKKDYSSSEDIYKRILQIDPENEKARRKSQHFLAMRDPSKVRYEDLPPITLITEHEKLRSIEVDFLQFKSSLTRATSKFQSLCRRSCVRNLKSHQEVKETKKVQSQVAKGIRSSQARSNARS